MWTRKSKLTLLTMVLVAVAIALGTWFIFANRVNRESIDPIIYRYSTPPQDGLWSAVADTEPFWDDVAALYAAADHGNAPALRALLLIRSYSDGAISEEMPDIQLIVARHKPMASRVIMGEDRLRNRFGHWL
jgi:hypothetical protein